MKLYAVTHPLAPERQFLAVAFDETDLTQCFGTRAHWTELSREDVLYWRAQGKPERVIIAL